MTKALEMEIAVTELVMEQGGRMEEKEGEGEVWEEEEEEIEEEEKALERSIAVMTTTEKETAVETMRSTVMTSVMVAPLSTMTGTTIQESSTRTFLRSRLRAAVAEQEEMEEEGVVVEEETDGGQLAFRESFPDSRWTRPARRRMTSWPSPPRRLATASWWRSCQRCRHRTTTSPSSWRPRRPQRT